MSVTSVPPSRHRSAEHLPPLDSPAVIYALRWLIRDTFRQALASRIFWIMLAVSGLCIFFCLGFSVESTLSPPEPHDTSLYTTDNKEFTGAVPGTTGKVTLLFGFLQIDHSRHVEVAVRFLQVVLASFVAGVVGFLLTLVWTAGFLPDFLQPHSAAVLLAKPLPRWTLLTGKYLGVITFVAFQIAVFFTGTWLALSLRTGVWHVGYLISIPLFVLHFAIIYSFAVLMATATRSTIACIFAIVLFWLMCWGLNVGRHFLVAFEAGFAGGATLAPVTSWLVELSYWTLPKPADIMIILEQALGAQNYTTTLSTRPEFQVVLQQQAFHPIASILASVGFSGVMLYLSAVQLEGTDY